MSEMADNLSKHPSSKFAHGKYYRNSEECLFLCSVYSSGRKFVRLKNLFLSVSSESDEIREKIKEALLQVYLFAGFPTALHSLKLFHSINGAVSEEFEKYDDEKFTSRGLENCGLVYGKNVGKLLANISSYSEQLAYWVLREGYGKVYGREKLSFREREIVAVGALAALGLEEQLISHLKGLKRSGMTHSGIKNLIELFCIVSDKKHGKRIMKIFERFTELTGS
ncbi:MAG: carboxymuconolactone decarboxylase family protein [Ignavibacteriaceae bacterium]|nr:carboxymuconolactone decarboxylase family protein [Ignavibacteriaceae bacterium]